jgi:hypothetical protein
LSAAGVTQRAASFSGPRVADADAADDSAAGEARGCAPNAKDNRQKSILKFTPIHPEYE